MGRLGFRDAIEQLQVPQASEAWSPLSGTSYVVIDVRGDDAEPSAAASATAIESLAALPCPTIALGAPSPTVPPALVAACDVAVTSEEELAAVTAAIMRAPLAAATLVQVLRASATLDVAAGLAVESLAYAALQGGPEHARWLASRAAHAPAPPDATPAVEMTRTADGLVLTLARPQRHNAFSAAMRDDLVAALGLAVLEPELAVVLRGAGPSFCSGGDLDEFGTRPDPATAHLVRTTRSPAQLLARVATRVRAELHGACIGAGIELAAFARSVIARPDAFVVLPEVAMGLIPGAGGTVSLPRRIGRQRTALLALSGHRLDVATAHVWGLVDAIEPAPLS